MLRTVNFLQGTTPVCFQARSRRFLTPTVNSNHARANTGSAKLWADAIKEDEELEASSSSSSPSHISLSRLQILQQEQQKYENWTGEESMQDAVLRMLVDKYKPLRSGSIRSADEKLRRAPPTVRGFDGQGEIDGDGGAGTIITASPPQSLNIVANEPLIAPIEGHKPWHTTFKPPSHVVNVKFGNFAARPVSPSSSLSSSDINVLNLGDEKKEREAKRKLMKAERLTRARESTIDYRLGVKKSAAMQNQRPNPVSVKGWTSLVEERIERARSEGQFKSISGRGKPLVLQTDEANPFIAREEFLMNRIVQRNGAAPPWVELQNELDSTLNAFRAALCTSWTRRLTRTYLSSTPLPLLRTLTLASVRAQHDPEWEARERAYHDAAVEEINALVRRYNGVAPYPVRRTYVSREGEVARAREGCAEVVLEEVMRRVRGGGGGAKGEVWGAGFADEDERGGGVVSGEDSRLSNERQEGTVLRFVRRWFSRWAA